MVTSMTAPFTLNKNIYRLAKRTFDLVVASTLLILLSPLFLLVAILIKLESKGPIFYASKRVGEAYKIFDFYKFRSMRTDADQLLENMKQLNQYGANDSTGVAFSNPFSWEEKKGNELVGDDGYINDEKWLELEFDDQQKAFVKIKNDPRITKIGQFIRNTSIDELPQLVNVLKGDMSLVGNRPLPLYEAVKLTSDEAIGRFLAPAGITGLWQVTERGKGKGDPNSRKRLDVNYALKANFLLDMWILLRTPLAAFQQENV
jgi:lipopolysaccharide/colanic/teichoic acid biosynthesis glycosyltransferase